VTATEDPLAALPYAFGAPCVRALVRSTPEDFLVTELPLVEPDGNGQHLLVRVRKRNCTTPDVARELAQQCGVARRTVSWAGLKDRQAVAEQWFSIDLAGRPDPGLTGGRGFEVLEVQRHGRKLRRGALAGNAFELLLREVDGEREAIEARLAGISKSGVPNYFGPQRFGRRGDNVEQALAMFAGKLRVRGREQRSILLSAARSHIFNAILGERVSADDWNHALPGDVLQWQGSRSHFLWDGSETERIETEIAALELHPTGALWGRQGSQATDDMAEREEAVAGRYPELVQGLVDAGMDSDRRALRLMVSQLEWHWEEDTLRLQFELPPGAYATTVLREVLIVT